MNFKIKSISLLTVFIFVCTQSAYPLPTGEEVISGTATFEQINENTLNITATDQAILEFQSFDIGLQETVNFFLPTIESTTLNRILGGQTSILGTLTANGNLILINTDGFFLF